MFLKNRIAHFMKPKGYYVIVSYTKDMSCVKYPHTYMYSNEKYSIPIACRNKNSRNLLCQQTLL